jgi:hypothetical protein
MRGKGREGEGGEEGKAEGTKKTLLPVILS